MAAIPEPRTTVVFLRWRVGRTFFLGPAVVEHARKKKKLFRKNVHYGPTFYTNPALGVGGGGPVLHCHRLAWAGSPVPSRDGEVG